MSTHLAKTTDAYARSYYITFITALISCLSPFKELGFSVPFIAIAVFVIVSRSGVVFTRFLFTVACLIVITAGYTFIYAFQKVEFNISNAIVSYLHYSSFLFLLIVPVPDFSKEYPYLKYAKILLLVVVFEGSWGIVQRLLADAMYGRISSGDFVQGSISPFSPAIKNRGFGNQMFVVNMVFFLLFLLPYVLVYRKGLPAVLICLMSLILASVGHVFYSLLFGIVVTLVFFSFGSIVRNFKLIFFSALALALIFSVMTVLDAGVVADTSRQAGMFFSGDTPKSEAIRVAFNELPKQYPTVYTIGLGPGQYSSRTGMIASGTYGSLSVFFTNIPALNVGMTEPFRKFVLESWKIVNTNLDAYGNSTMYRPFFSLLSLYTEFGLVFCTLLIVFIFSKLRRLKRRYLQYEHASGVAKTDRNLMKYSAFACAAGILFLVMIGVYENYFETPQAILPGLMLTSLLGRYSLQGVTVVSNGQNVENENAKAKLVVV